MQARSMQLVVAKVVKTFGVTRLNAETSNELTFEFFV